MGPPCRGVHPISGSSLRLYLLSCKKGGHDLNVPSPFIPVALCRRLQIRVQKVLWGFT